MENDRSALDVCDVCGRANDADGADLSVDLEVISQAGIHYVSFCRQEHAAEWLGRPLPAPDEAFGGASTHGDRIFSAMAIALVLWLVALAVLGQVTVVRWIWS